MEVLCEKSLYWHQEPGYDGFLLEEAVFDGKDGLEVFKEGKKYHVVATPSRRNLERVVFFAIGEDERWYRILDAEVHYRETTLALDHFDFSESLNGYRDPRRKKGENITKEAAK